MTIWCQEPRAAEDGSRRLCGVAIKQSGPPLRTVVFLDIDGVLNRWSTTHRIGPFVGLDSELLERFEIDPTGFEIGEHFGSECSAFPPLTMVQLLWWCCFGGKPREGELRVSDLVRWAQTKAVG